ncbi:MAG: ABC transporter ATP-binding protein [Clostridiales bacterium]|jgi:putative ABC transport system ATP-binding protein|nr:ABC transporter ATP-binding protein [Clostridiales bacterium]
MQELIRGIDIKKIYKTGDVQVEALRGLSITLYEGEFIVILGPSGSGKSTLLNILGGIDAATSGQVLFEGQNLCAAPERVLTHYRRQAVGFVFQFYNLMPNLTARENIQLAADIAAQPFDVDAMLRDVDMSDRAGHFPSQLSGGQQQRVAIARAVAKNPRMLLCDEPTGALDVQTGVQVLRVLRHFNRDYGKTVAIITHNAGIAGMADKVFTIRDGVIAAKHRNAHPIPPEEVAW